jgi:uncharacterized protein YndB with AHSA1/START domain
MELSTSRTIDAPIERVWALQIDHEHWPQHLPNFSKAVRHAPGSPFGVGSSADITQPGLGTVTWTVDHCEETPSRKCYSWSGASRGTRYTGRHEVAERIGGRTQLTLTILADGGVVKWMGLLVKGRMRAALEAEALAFERWATSDSAA